MSGRVRISIHAPLAGRDLTTFGLWAITPIFQSTRPLRGATMSITQNSLPSSDFNPRAPCGARLMVKQTILPMVGISIHAPLAGRDTKAARSTTWPSYFNPRTPCGARLSSNSSTGRQPEDFNPRTPCGARLKLFGSVARVDRISIHAPLAGCDRGYRDSTDQNPISIHAPLAGCDKCPLKITNNMEAFQSTHPLRGATCLRCKHIRQTVISIHAPLAGCDQNSCR